MKTVSKKNLKFDTNLYYKLRDQDIFYNMKFMKSIFKFPYTISFLKNFKINSYLFFYLSYGKISSVFYKKNYRTFYSKAFSKILEKNIAESHNFYVKKELRDSFIKLLNHIDDYFKKSEVKYSIVIVPQYYDLKL